MPAGYPERVTGSRTEPVASLRVVGGDGEGDRLLASGVAPVAPAWRPVGEHVLAYVDRAGRVNLVGADDRRERVADQAGPPGSHGLEWSRDGKWLLAWSPNLIRVYGAGGRLDTAIRVPKRLHTVLAATFRPGTRIDRIRRVREEDWEEQRLRLQAKLDRTLQWRSGRFRDLTWSPDRKWLLVSWPSADQWAFLEIPGAVRRIDAVGGITAEFDPGAAGGAFPLVEGWCCAG